MPHDDTPIRTTPAIPGEVVPADGNVGHLGDTVGYLNGCWLAAEQMHLSVLDDGFRFAATAVERLRTYGGTVFQLPAHLDRLHATVDALGISGLPEPTRMEELVRTLIRRNDVFLRRCGDVGITIVVTPGTANQRPTVAMHLNTIDHEKVARRRGSGQPLVITDVVQPPAESWPRGIKVRCRLHYYLADRIAERSHVDASGILLDTDASITETSIANVAFVRNGTVISPPPERVLGGITQQVIEQIADEHSVAWIKRPIDPQELTEADEVILMGTDTGFWFANRVDKSVLRPGPVYHRLLGAFDELTSNISPN